MRTMGNGMLFRAVLVQSYGVDDGGPERTRTATTYYGPYVDRRQASAALTARLRRAHGALGWVEGVNPEWVKVSPVRSA